MSEETPQSILEGDWHRELEAEAGRRTDTLRRAAHFTSLVEVLEKVEERLVAYPNRILGWGNTDGRRHILVEDVRYALKAAEEAEVGQPECPSCAVTLSPDAAHAGDCEVEE